MHRWLLGIALSLASLPGTLTGAGAGSYFDDAQRLLAKGQLRAAEIQLKNAVRSDPSNMEAHYRLAMVQLQLGEAAAAEHEAEVAWVGGYDSAAVVPLLADAYLAQGKYRELLRGFPATKGSVAERSRVLVARGYAQLALDHPDDARGSFEQAQQLALNSPQPLLAEAKLAMSQGKLPASEALFNRALSLDPKSKEGLLGKAELLRRKKEPQQALALLDQTLAASADFFPARIERAQILLSQGDKQAAKKDIDAVLAAQPGNVPAIYLDAVISADGKNYQKANADLQRISAAIPSLPRGYYVQALVQFNLRQLDQAAASARRYVARNLDDMAGHKLLGTIELALGRPTDAIDTLAKFDSAGKADAGVLYLLGRAYAAIGKSADAIAAFEKALKLAPQNAELHTRLGAAQLQSGDVADAVKELQQSLDIAPTASAGEILVMSELAAGRWDAADAAAQRLQQAQPNSPVAGNLIGLIKLARFDLDGARSKFAALSRKFPAYLPARLNLARVLELQGKPDEAEAILTKILAEKPADGLALTRLVDLLVRNGKGDAAIAAADRAHAAAPTNPAITSGLIDLYIRLGHKDKALALARQESGENTLANFPLILARARAEFAAGLKADAIRTYSRLIEIAPSRVDLRRQYAAALVATGDVAGARQAIDQALKTSRRDPRLADDRIAIDVKTSGIGTALTTAAELQKQDPTLPTAAALQGDAYMQAREYGQAAKVYAAALQHAPSAMLAIRLARAKAAAGGADAAASVLRDWLAGHPGDIGVVEILGSDDIIAHRFDEAKKEFERVLQKAPQNVVALNNLAWLYQRAGDPRARPLAERAYLLAPTVPQTADTLGWILVQQGDPAGAIGLLTLAHAERKSDASIQYHLAVALNDLGRREQAIALLAPLVKATSSFEDKGAAEKLFAQLSKK